MEDNKRKSSWGTIISAILLSVLILGFLAFAFFNWIMPYFSIKSADLYSFLIKILPFLVGIILIVIGVSIKYYKQKEFDEALRDKIRLDNLFSLPNEEPNTAKEESNTVPAEQVEEEKAVAAVSQIEFTEDDYDDKDNRIPHLSTDFPDSDSLEDYDQQLSKQLDEITSGITDEPQSSITESKKTVSEPEVEEEQVIVPELEEIASSDEEIAPKPEEISVSDEIASEPEENAPNPEVIVSMSDVFSDEKEELVTDEELVPESEYVSIIDSNNKTIRLIDSVDLPADYKGDEFVDVNPVNQESMVDYCSDELKSAVRLDYDITFAHISECDDISPIEIAFNGGAKVFKLEDDSYLVVILFFSKDEFNSVISSLGLKCRITSRKGRAVTFSSIKKELEIA